MPQVLETPLDTPDRIEEVHANDQELPEDLESVLVLGSLGGQCHEIANILSLTEDRVKEVRLELEDFFRVTNVAAATHRAIQTGKLPIARRQEAGPRLTEHQARALGYIANGLNNRQMGEKFHKDPRTVKYNIVRPLVAKLEARNKSHLVRLGHEFGQLT